MIEARVWRRWRCPGVAFGLALALGGCAPPPPPVPPSRDTVMERYLDGRTARERRASGLAADVLLWTRIRGEARPGVSGRLWIVAPDAARLAIDGAFGVACDLAARGDTLEGWIAARRSAVTLDAGAGDAGPAPGAAACRALGGLWQPPGAAWDGATVTDEGWRLGWAERGDSITMMVGADGRPRWLEWRPAAGDTLRVRYRSWSAVDDTPWPDRLEWSETRGDLAVSTRLTRLRVIPVPDPSRMRAAIPVETRRVSVEEMSAWWGELTGGPR